MAAAVSAAYALALKVAETLGLALDHATDVDAEHDFAISGTLNGTSTPPATKAFSDEGQLSGGTKTIDLTALVGALAASVDFTGLKVQLVKIRADSANTSTITVKDGATNGYNLFGDASGQITLGAKDAALLFFNDSLPDVAAGAKDIDITSSDVDAKYDIIIVAG